MAAPGGGGEPQDEKRGWQPGADGRVPSAPPSPSPLPPSSSPPGVLVGQRSHTCKFTPQSPGAAPGGTGEPGAGSSIQGSHEGAGAPSLTGAVPAAFRGARERGAGVKSGAGTGTRGLQWGRQASPGSWVPAEHLWVTLPLGGLLGAEPGSVDSRARWGDSRTTERVPGPRGCSLLLSVLNGSPRVSVSTSVKWGCALSLVHTSGGKAVD